MTQSIPSDNPKVHAMILSVDDNDFQHWHCPLCDRALVIDWSTLPPTTLTIHPGNMGVMHTGDSGGKIRIASTRIENGGANGNANRSNK